MTTKQLRQYPNLIKYFETKHARLYEVIEALGLYGLLVPRKNGGITFLVPSGEYLDKIHDMAYSETPDDAISMIKSLIIVDFLSTPEEWDKKRSDIPNLLGQRLEVLEVNKEMIKLKGLNGQVILQPDSSFKPMASRNNMSVWNIKSGRISLSGPKASLKFVKTKKGNKQDDVNENQSNGPEDRRIELVEKLENKYDQGNSNAFLEFMATLMRVIRDEDPKLYEKVRPMLDASPIVSFYLLVEPLKPENGSSYIIPSFILNKCRHKLPNSSRQWKSHFVALAGAEDIEQIVQDISLEFQDKVGKEKLKIARKYYADFDQGNVIAPYLPADTREYYQLHPGLKRWQDGARHLIRKAFREELNTRRSLIQSMFDAYAPEIMETIVTNPTFYKRGVSMAVFEGLAGEFIASDLFMYYIRPPHPAEEEDTYDFSGETWNELSGDSDNDDHIENTLLRQMICLRDTDRSKYDKIMSKLVSLDSNESKNETN